MTVELRAPAKDEQAVIMTLLDQYLRELSHFRQFAVGATNAAEYPYLQSYWSEPDRFPFTVWSNHELAGFAPIRRISDEHGGVMQLAEFFIQPQYRRQGIGHTAAVALWKQFPGRWELQVMKDNRPAIEFWRNCIHAQAQVWHVDEIIADDGPRLFFHFEVR
jgi:predicted acetyltransferase